MFQIILKKHLLFKCSVDIYGLFMLSQQEFRSNGKRFYALPLASLLASSLFSQYGGGDKAGNGQGVAEGFQIDRLKSFQSFLKLNRKVGYVVHGITPEGINHHRVNFFFHHQSMSNNFHYSGGF